MSIDYRDTAGMTFPYYRIDEGMHCVWTYCKLPDGSTDVGNLDWKTLSEISIDALRNGDKWPIAESYVGPPYVQLIPKDRRECYLVAIDELQERGLITRSES